MSRAPSAPRGPTALSPAVRRANLSRMGNEPFDVLVIGGGINGAGIARDAAMRGLRVALIEKGDFASGTSSRSSKLIHGGLRYLEMGDFRLVHEACVERDRLRRRLAPHLVKPMAFLFPVYRGDPVGLLRLEVGMWLYDLLAGFRNIKLHRRLSRRRVAKLEPALKQDGLKGAERYYDCATDDARLTFETILAASSEGAVVANYVRVIEFLKEGGPLTGARIRDERTGDAYAVRARVVVNATGPWVDEIRRLDDPAATPCLRLTKGVHVVVPRDRVGNQHAIVLRSPRDQRILFVLPWEDQTLIGTTDTDFTGPPDTVSVDKEDIEYLLEAVNAFFPRAHLTPADTMGSFAGLRPLVAPDGHVDPSATSREQRILCSPSGLISLAGGKLTTFRAVSEAVTDQVLQHLGTRPTPRGRRRAKRTPLPGGLFPPTDGKDADAKRISERYGARAPEVLALLREDEHLSNPIVAGLPYTKGEVVYAVKAEMAQDVEDILRRRTPLEVQNSRAASEAARDVEAMIASLVDEDEDPYE